MNTKIFRFILVSSLFIPAMALAHPGIQPEQWPGHVLSDPFGGLDHALAMGVLVSGLMLTLWKPSTKFLRVSGVLMAAVGLVLFWV